MATSKTKLEIYLAEVTLNEGHPAEKMIVIERHDIATGIINII